MNEGVPVTAGHKQFVPEQDKSLKPWLNRIFSVDFNIVPEILKRTRKLNQAQSGPPL